MSNHKKGFTLVELLVVIAIIGVLSSVVFASLTSARGKARIASAQQTLHNVQAVATACVVTVPATALSFPAATEAISSWTTLAICSGSANWPALPGDWTYCDGTTGTGCSIVTTSDTTAGTFTIGARSVADGKSITCTVTGCTTN